jgi:integrase
MSRETSPYPVGEFWLDKRRDGKSPDVWQIASYDAKSRCVSYRSTRCRSLDDAKLAINAHHARMQARRPQTDVAHVVPLLRVFWDEKGSKAIRDDTVASSLRAFIGFLMQDRASIAVTVAELNHMLFERFLAWRMGPHGWDLEWAGKPYSHRSQGVVGESVQRNLDDIRWALSYQADNGRIPYTPKIKQVPARLRSEPRSLLLTIDQLGAMVGFARSDQPMLRHLQLLIGTAMRPEAAMKMDPASQYDAEHKLIDLHPKGAPRTKKRNPVVPVIPELAPVLASWAKEKATPVGSKRTAWRTMRRALGLPEAVVMKTVRHTIATRLRSMGVPAEEISGLLGHAAMSRTTSVYAKYDPNHLVKAKRALSKIWRDVMAAADSWSAGHLRAKVGNGLTVVHVKGTEKD